MINRLPLISSIYRLYLIIINESANRKALRKAIGELIDPYLKDVNRHDIYVNDDQLELLIKENEDTTSQLIIIRLTVSEKFEEIYISNIMMPTFMKHHGIGKQLIAKIYDIAISYKYALCIVQMTQQFYDRMIRRGALSIEEGDCVQITDDTKLIDN